MIRKAGRLSKQSQPRYIEVSIIGGSNRLQEQSAMVWVGEPMTWILIGVAGGVVLGLICIIWATQGRPLSENPHHDEF
jgi:hypothetical protein